MIHAFFKKIALGLIRSYQLFISPLLGPRCRFYPTCSRYAQEAVKTHGLWRGGRMALLRLIKCGPFHPGGYDPVPPGAQCGCQEDENMAHTKHPKGNKKSA